MPVETLRVHFRPQAGGQLQRGAERAHGGAGSRRGEGGPEGLQRDSQRRVKRPSYALVAAGPPSGTVERYDDIRTGDPSSLTP
ncbi:hypothetical protein VTK73DRAFT_9230 [Phialemonium thermophilum]|uniref:Uncharacterized protein n=1 Tax=Phialemonium thermophilum TaxID=223376 RepID=A0ABR3W3L3_9PEZI